MAAAAAREGGRSNELTPTETTTMETEATERDILEVSVEKTLKANADVGKTNGFSLSAVSSSSFAENNPCTQNFAPH